jgi:hypothetical protein
MMVVLMGAGLLDGIGLEGFLAIGIGIGFG